MSLDETTSTLIGNMDEIADFKRWLGERHENDTIAIDTETSGLDPRDPGARIRLIQFGDTQHGWAMSWEDWRGAAMEAMTQYEGTFAFHNASFEYKWFDVHANWIPPRDRSVDTMIAAHIINPLGSGGLKQLSRKYVDKEAAGGETALKDAMRDNGWTWDTVPIDFKAYWSYAAVDTILTARLWDEFKPQVEPQGEYGDVFALEMATRFVASRMESNGALINLQYATEKREKLTYEANAIEAWAAENFDGLKISSNDQLAEKIVELGGVLLDKTSTGKLKVDKYTLEALSNPDEGFSDALQALTGAALRARQKRKTSSTYFRQLVEKHVNGYIHANIRTLGARTARMSIADPPLQQLPKSSPLVRNAFIPSPGNTLITCDYSQIEMRLMAEASGDADLIEAFRVADATGGDFFVEMGKQIYADPRFKRADKRRGLIKSTLYGKAYGAGPAKMAESAGITPERMKDFVETLDVRYPGINDFMHTVEQVGRKREQAEGQGYIKTPVGRRLPSDEGKLYTLTNYFIQSSAADVLKKALIRLDASGYDEFMILPVHDEIVLDIPKEHAEQALRDVPLLMEERDHAVPLTADADGPLDAWGSKY